MSFSLLRNIFIVSSLRKKILFSLLFLAIYRLLVPIPIPFVDITLLMSDTTPTSGALANLAILLGGALQQSSIIAVGLIPFINASIIMQLLQVVIPKLEELQMQGEQGQQQIQQYTRYATFPLAFLQGIGAFFLINSFIPGVVDPILSNIVLSAFVMTVGSMLLLWLGEMMTEHGITNGISLIIFTSIVSGIVSQGASIFATGQQATELFSSILIVALIVILLIMLAILLIKSIKEIPIVYSRQGGLQETSLLPIPLNPVGMIPIIFAISFVSFPFLIAQFLTNTNRITNETVNDVLARIIANLDITQSVNPSLVAIIVFFFLIVLFTFFYTLVVFNPSRMADIIQQRGGFIPGIRPGTDTATYLSKVLAHLSLWGGLGLAFIGVYSYVITFLPVLGPQIVALGGQLPLLVQGSGIIIIVGVVQDVINKVHAELFMSKYDSLS